MASLNKVCLIGNLGKDPEVRSLGNGKKVVSFSIACTETWRDKQSGEKKEKTEWVPIVIFNEGLAGVAEDFLKKGSSIYVEGKLQTRKWQDQSGNDRYTTEVVLQNFDGTLKMLGGRGDGGGRSEDGGGRGSGRSDDSGGYRERSSGGRSGGSRAPAGGTAQLDDDIPF